MARAFGPQDRTWKWRAVESEENQAQVFALFPPPLEIGKRRDFHIPTAATAILSFPTSNSKKRTRDSLTPLIHSRFLPCRRLQELNALIAHARPYPHQTARRPFSWHLRLSNSNRVPTSFHRNKRTASAGSSLPRFGQNWTFERATNFLSIERSIMMSLAVGNRYIEPVPFPDFFTGEERAIENTGVALRPNRFRHRTS